MAKYINKDALVAEIKNLIERAEAERVLYPKTILAAKNYLLIEDYNKLLSSLNSLEVKEVDLEKELSTYLEEVKATDEDIDFVDFAKYFFELGLNAAQKGE